MSALTFPYQYRGSSRDPQTLAPILPVRLSRGGVGVDIVGLVDSGATFSVLSFDIGSRFGVPWNSLTTPIQLTGVLAGVSARMLAVHGVIGTLPPTPLIFAWCTSNTVPVLLGQVNFFEFDVCFFRSRAEFTVAPRTP